MKRMAYLCIAGMIFMGYEAVAQFTLSAEIRPRTEFRNGFKTLRAPTDNPVFFTEQRSRLYLDYIVESFKFKLAFQDVRIWGETPQVFKEEPGKTFISEAWGQYYITPTISVKAGRQIISYDNQRFFGGLEWAQQGRRHDALLILYENAESQTKLHLGGAYNQDNDVPEPAFLQSNGADFYSVRGNYKTIQYAWFNKKIGGGSMSLLALNAGYQNADTTVSNKQTWGANGSTVLGGIKFGADFYYQTGEQGGKNISAMLAGIHSTLATSVAPFTLGVEYISGDSNPADNKNTAFSPDFGTNHIHNGYMDYFFVGNANRDVGVTNIYLKTNFKLMEGTMEVQIHEFLTGSTQANGDGEKLGKTMGTEVDIVFAKKLRDGVVWHIGYSQMFATGTMQALRGGDKSLAQNWAWTMITFTPTLFTTRE